MFMIFHINKYNNEPKYVKWILLHNCQNSEKSLLILFTALLPLLLCIVDQCDPAK